MLGIKVIHQNQQGLVETLGKYSHTIDSGLHFYLPFVQHIRTVKLAMIPVTLRKYIIITKDNAEITTTVTLNYHVTDAVKFEYENTDSVESMSQLVRGHLRDIIGRMDLNEVLGSTAKINQDLAQAIGDLTNTYGINVDRINIDELTPSEAIQEAMDQQLTADRKRQASISQAQGDAQSIQLRTKAQNEALIATAQANADATKIKADAEKYRIDTIQAGLKNADEKYFENQSIEAYKTLAESNTNMIITGNDDTKTFGQFKGLKKVWDQDNNQQNQ